MRLGLNIGANPPSSRLFSDSQLLKENAPSGIGFVGLSRGTYRLDYAQSIRDGAGNQAGQEVGIQAGVTPGSSGSLTVRGAVNVSNEAAMQAAADSGNGTENDPYLFSDYDFNSASAAPRGLFINDAVSSYFVKFTNCNFRNGTAEDIQMNGPNITLTLENCTFENSNLNAEGLNHIGGTVIMEACYLKGYNGDKFYTNNTLVTGSLTVRNLKIDDSTNNWAASCNVFLCFADNCVFDFQYVDANFSTNLNQAQSLFAYIRAGDNSSFQNMLINGGDNLNSVFRDDAVTPNEKTGTLVKNCDLRETTAELIRLSYVTDMEIAYNEFRHTTTGANFRPLYIVGTSATTRLPTRTNIHHNYFNKTQGTNVAGNECCEVGFDLDFKMNYNWSENCPEDAFEAIFTRASTECQMLYNVADNSGGQGFDVFKMGDNSGNVETDSSLAADRNIYVAFAYGDATGNGLIITAARGVYFHDVYVVTDTTSQSVLIEDRDGTVVRRVYGSGPLPLAADRGSGGAVTVTGGADIEVNFFDTEDGSGTLTTVTN